MIREVIAFIVICVFAFVIGAVFACLTGCAHRVEYYENGQVKVEESGVLLSDGKQFSIISF